MSRLMPLWIALLPAVVALVAACGGGGSGGGGPSLPPKDVSVSWSPNREAAVNRAGGGYRVYYSQTSGFNPGPGVNFTDVPYQSGPQAPTTTTVSLVPGTWHLRVTAYSALSRPGSASPSESAGSAQVTLVVP